MRGWEVGRGKSKQTELTQNVEPETEVYLGLRVDLTLVVTFVCHSKLTLLMININFVNCSSYYLPRQINAEDPVISGRRVTNRHSAAIFKGSTWFY